MATVAAGVFAAALATVAPASADEGNNDAFLKALSSAGVGFNDPNSTAALGQAICPILAQPGGNFAQAASTVTGSGIPPGMAGLFTTIAIQMYCPTMINQMANGDFSSIGNLAGIGNFMGMPKIAGLPGS
ncbi:DUF732 domain-containing protein [Mycolicibacterium sp. P9-64]|uniref:DUF732 domain-containing protein n=1 Tax=Mycolicibacterium sp. P9-64 TaxID=2024612 RepID=UPI0011ED08CD|nr:DUF732 domain-containing protein [Mycolicibacterium sp. P9-64]KAA0085541.1 DUF732 domain-containing protein [Mycolicibacterium sp. P9-64]